MSDMPDMSLNAIIARADARYRKNLERMNYFELSQELDVVLKCEANLLADGSEHARYQAATFAADAEMVREEMRRKRPN